MESGNKVAKLFDYLKRLTNKTPIDESQEEFEKGYSQYMINRFFSCDKNLVILAKEMNRSGITNQMHFDFMDVAIPKSKKFIKYNLKKAKKDQDLQYLCEFYKINMDRAREYMRLISEDEMKEVRAFFEKRGKK